MDSGIRDWLDRKARQVAKLVVSQRIEGVHLTRYSMYRALAQTVRSRPRSVLSISGSLPLCEVVGWSGVGVVAADYPDVSILDLPYDDMSFDGLVADQVLEHVAGSPQTAIDESARVLRPGGTMIQTTCFVNPRHDTVDLWRFSPGALELMAKRAGLEVVAVSGWGNFGAVAACRLGLRRLRVPDATWHPVHRLATRSDPDWMITTWIVAQRPR